MKHEQQKRADVDWRRNYRPGMVGQDRDYAENLDVKNWRKLQKEHWESLGVTIFISIYHWLKVKAWNSTESLLSENDEVTVHGELAGEKIALDSYWAKVKHAVEEVDASGAILVDVIHPKQHVVVDAHGKERVVSRKELRHRDTFSVAIGGISDDKKHDRHSANKFGELEKEWLAEYIADNCPEDLPTGKLEDVHCHSDNAGSHFKSTGSMEAFTHLWSAGGLRRKCRSTCHFGQPGHGKVTEPLQSCLLFPPLTPLLFSSRLSPYILL
jgi:hypothetical protein